VVVGLDKEKELENKIKKEQELIRAPAIT